MPLWEGIIEVLRESIFAYAQVCHGNFGWGILVVTFLARLALAPLGIRLARATQLHQAAIGRIQPELEAIRRRHEGNARRAAEETRRLMARENVPLAPAGALGMLAQLPVLIALYMAVRQVAAVGGRFLWIANIARPDLGLTFLVAGLTYGATLAGRAAGVPNQNALLLLSTIMTVVVLSKMAAGIGLYWGLSTMFSGVQAVIVRRTAQPAAA